MTDTHQDEVAPAFDMESNLNFIDEDEYCSVFEQSNKSTGQSSNSCSSQSEMSGIKGSPQMA